MGATHRWLPKLDMPIRSAFGPAKRYAGAIRASRADKSDLMPGIAASERWRGDPAGTGVFHPPPANIGSRRPLQGRRGFRHRSTGAAPAAAIERESTPLHRASLSWPSQVETDYRARSRVNGAERVSYQSSWGGRRGIGYRTSEGYEGRHGDGEQRDISDASVLRAVVVGQPSRTR